MPSWSTSNPRHLYDFFDKLLTPDSPDNPLLTSPAVWHIPNPGHLLSQSANEWIDHQGSKNQHKLSVKRLLRDGIVHSLTFGELKMAASRLAIRLSIELRKALGYRYTDSKMMTSEQSKMVVALFMPPGIDRIVAQIACMELRLAYLPVDRQLSVGRIVQIIENVRPVMTIVAQTYHTSIFSARSRTPSAPEGRQTNAQLNWQRGSSGDSFLSGKLKSLHKTLNPFLVLTYEELAESPPEEDDKVVHFYTSVPDPVVVVLSTSGSTSTGPKVVRLRNSQLVNRLKWQWDTNMETGPDENWQQSSSPGCAGPGVSLASTAWVFIDAFTQLFSALFAGWPVVVPGAADCASEVCVSDAHILVRLIDLFNVSCLTTVPLQLNTWLEQLRLMPPEERGYQTVSLRTVVVSGDLLRPKLATEFFELFGKASVRLVNLYGTTELAGDVTAAVFHDIKEVQEATNAIERRASNLQLFYIYYPKR